jgi:hypothetical protein
MQQFDVHPRFWIEFNKLFAEAAMGFVATGVNYLRKRRSIESKNRNNSKGRRIFTCFQISSAREPLHSFQGRNMRIRLKVMMFFLDKTPIYRGDENRMLVLGEQHL